jgi:integral membrane protein
MTEVVSPVRPAYAGALLRYRVMAWVTGVILATATIMLIIQDVFDVNSVKTPTGLLWVAHGYCFLIYIVTVLHLWSKLRWSFVRLVAVGLAGTIPGLSFVAEHYTTKYVRARESASRAG